MRILIAMAVFGAPAAHASNFVHVGAAHEWAIPTEAAGPALGPGVAATLGYGVRLKIARLIPEVGAAYYYESGVFVPRAGARLILGFLITPGIYAHANAAIGGPFGDALPFGFDAGASLHMTIPYVRFGGYGGIQAFGGETGPDIPDVGFVGGLEIALVLPTKKTEEETEEEIELEEPVPEAPLEPIEPDPAPPIEVESLPEIE